MNNAVSTDVRLNGNRRTIDNEIPDTNDDDDENKSDHMDYHRKTESPQLEVEDMMRIVPERIPSAAKSNLVLRPGSDRFTNETKHRCNVITCERRCKGLPPSSDSGKFKTQVNVDHQHTDVNTKQDVDEVRKKTSMCDYEDDGLGESYAARSEALTVENSHNKKTHHGGTKKPHHGTTRVGKGKRGKKGVGGAKQHRNRYTDASAAAKRGGEKEQISKHIRKNHKHVTIDAKRGGEKERVSKHIRKNYNHRHRHADKDGKKKTRGKKGGAFKSGGGKQKKNGYDVDEKRSVVRARSKKLVLNNTTAVYDIEENLIKFHNISQNYVHDERPFVHYVVNSETCDELASRMIDESPDITAIELFIVLSVCEGLVNPMDSGFGGGTQIVLYSHVTKRGYYINARERASKHGPLPKSPGRSALHIGVPSILRGYEYLYKNQMRYGYRGPRTKWSRLFYANARLARDGFRVSNRVMNAINTYKFYNAVWTVSNETYVKNKLMYGFIMRVAKEGPESSLYKPNGYLNRHIGKELKSFESGMSYEDLYSYNVDPTDYAANTTCMYYRVFTTRLPGSGVLELFGCRMLEDAIKRYDYHLWSNSQQFIYDLRVLHLMQSLQMFLKHYEESTLLPRLLANVERTNRHIVNTLTKKFPKRIAKRIGNIKFPIVRQYGTRDERGTSNICVSDATVDLCATSTINWSFGSQLYSSYGFFYNNELSDFTFSQHSANRPRSGTQPLSSISPMIFIDDTTPGRDDMEFTLGSAGGVKIVPANYFVMSDYILQRTLFEHFSSPRYPDEFRYDCNSAQKKPRCYFYIETVRPNARALLTCESELPLLYATLLNDMRVDVTYRRESGYSSTTTLIKRNVGCYDPRRGGASSIKILPYNKKSRKN